MQTNNRIAPIQASLFPLWFVGMDLADAYLRGVLEDQERDMAVCWKNPFYDSDHSL